MPTVLTIDSFQVRILTNDHEPAHVHVYKDDGEAKIKLGLDDIPPDLILVSRKMKDKDATRALEIVLQNNEVLLAKWREIHA